MPESNKFWKNRSVSCCQNRTRTVSCTDTFWRLKIHDFSQQKLLNIITWHSATGFDKAPNGRFWNIFWHFHIMVWVSWFFTWQWIKDIVTNVQRWQQIWHPSTPSSFFPLNASPYAYSHSERSIKIKYVPTNLFRISIFCYSY